MSVDQEQQKLLAAPEENFQKNHTVSARGPQSVKYGRPASLKWYILAGSPTQKPTKPPAALVSVLGSHSVMPEDVRLETLNTLPKSGKEGEGG